MRRRTRRIWTLAAACAAALSAAACTNSTSSPSSTTTPAATRTTDTFTGTVQVKGSDVHTFAVQNSGQVDATLTATAPAATMGLAIGTPSGSTCPAIAGASRTATAAATAQISGILSPASYCVAVFDIGNQTQPVSYTVTVVHP